MPAIQIPGTNITYGWQEREDGWSGGMNTNLVVLGYLAKGSVLSRSVDTPPVDPDEGDRYIVPANPFGEWGGHSNKVAMYLSGAWIYIEPFQIPMLVIDEDVHVYWDGEQYKPIKGSEAVAELEALVVAAQQAATTATQNAQQTSADRVATGQDAQATAAAAASLNLPTIQPGDAGRGLVVNAEEDGYETTPIPSYSIVPVVLSLTGGDFASGTLTCVKIGNQVTLSTTGALPEFSSNTTVGVASAAVPASMRPTVGVGYAEVAVAESGDFIVHFATARTTFPAHVSITYNI